MSDAELERERESYREAIQLAVRIGEGLQRRVDLAAEYAAAELRDPHRRTLLAILRGET